MLTDPEKADLRAVGVTVLHQSSPFSAAVEHLDGTRGHISMHALKLALQQKVKQGHPDSEVRRFLADNTIFSGGQ